MRRGSLINWHGAWLSNHWYRRRQRHDRGPAAAAHGSAAAAAAAAAVGVAQTHIQGRHKHGLPGGVFLTAHRRRPFHGRAREQGGQACRRARPLGRGQAGVGGQQASQARGPAAAVAHGRGGRLLARGLERGGGDLLRGRGRAARCRARLWPRCRARTPAFRANDGLGASQGRALGNRGRRGAPARVPRAALRAGLCAPTTPSP